MITPDAGSPTEVGLGEPASERPSPSAAETHISWLFFTPDQVLKLNKPVRTAYLDHSFASARISSADREIELNRRLAPDVYIGHADLVVGGDVTDRIIVMRRLPSDRALSARLRGPAGAEDLRAVARAVAAFHASLEPISETMPLTTTGGLSAFWRSSAADLRSGAATLLAADEVDEALDLAIGFLEHHEQLLDDRRASGFVRDGHGDLIADDIFMLDEGPRILDCLAFDDDYRIGDVLADIAFLVMDVERLAGAELSRRLLRWYCEFSGERHPASLAHHYVAYRAHVRAKVAALRAAQGDDSAAALVRLHHDQALDHLRRGRAHLLLVGGGPGTGKSTLANALSLRLGWVLLDSDTLRKDLFGVGHLDHDVEDHPELYAPDTTDRTYAELVERAGILLAAGESVVLDATWRDERHRSRARSTANEHGARVLEIECRLDDDVARERIERRRRHARDASDACAELVGRSRDPWPTAVVIDTADPPELLVDTVVEGVDLPWLRSGG